MKKEKRVFVAIFVASNQTCVVANLYMFLNNNADDMYEILKESIKSSDVIKIDDEIKRKLELIDYEQKG